MTTAQQSQKTAEEIEADLSAIGNDFDEGDDNDADAVATPAQSAEAAALETELLEVEAKASRQGWVPREQYRGDPKKWVDAKTFVERGERFVVNLQQEIATLREQVESFNGTKAAFIKFHEEVVARKDSELKEAIEALRIQRSEAQSEGDHRQVVEIEDRIDLLKEQQKELKAPLTQGGDAASTSTAAQKQGADMTNPVLLEWIEDGNQWFKDEPKLRDYAIAIGDHMVSNGETIRGRAFLDKIREHMEREFPRRFKKSSASGDSLANATSGSGNATSSGQGSSAVGKTARDLPPEDRKLMREFIASGWTTEEKFLASYFSSVKR